MCGCLHVRMCECVGSGQLVQLRTKKRHHSKNDLFNKLINLIKRKIIEKSQLMRDEFLCVIN